MEQYVVKRYSQYKLGNSPFEYDIGSDRIFNSKSEAEEYANNADSGISHDTRYRYIVEPRRPVKYA